MFNIKLLNNISDIICENLPRDKYNVGPDVDNVHGIIVRSASMHEEPLPDTLLAIARAGAGVNNIPIDKCTENGIVVFNTPGANANAVKELVLAGLLLSSRKIYQGISWTKSLKGNGNDIPKLVEKGKSNFTGPELLGKKLGVIGLGAIGVRVANDARAIGMDVTGYDPFISVQAAWGLSREVHRAESLDALLAESDYLTLHIPLQEDTRNFINKETLSKMKKGVRILNFARGELVNTEDLLEALKDGTVSCYVTDFPNEQLLDLDNVIPIPHLGASTPESEDNCAYMASAQLRDFLESGTIVNSVNFPSCEMPRNGHIRITITHKNIPNMVGQITSVLARHNINITNMVNKSKKSAAYTMIDIEDSLPEEVPGLIGAIDGVTRVRVIR